MTHPTNSARSLEAIAAFRPESLDRYLEIYHPAVTAHFLPPGLPSGIEGLRIFYGAFLDAFPDTALTADETFECNDRVVMRFTLRATHQAEFFGVPATGAPITVTGITIMRFEGGKCIERWSESNLAAVMVQLAKS